MLVTASGASQKASIPSTEAELCGRTRNGRFGVTELLRRGCPAMHDRRARKLRPRAQGPAKAMRTPGQARPT
eukprot:2656382-Prymnesium_polylepis.1